MYIHHRRDATLSLTDASTEYNAVSAVREENLRHASIRHTDAHTSDAKTKKIAERHLVNVGSHKLKQLKHRTHTNKLIEDLITNPLECVEYQRLV